MQKQKQKEDDRVEDLTEDLYGDLNTDADKEKVKQSIANLVEYSVPENEIRRTIYSRFQSDDIDPDEHDQDGKIEDLENEDEWFNLEVKVVDLWDPNHDSIDQVGLIGDETGVVKFTKWKSSDLPQIEQGESYRLESVVTEEYQERVNIKFTSETIIEGLDRNIEVGKDLMEVEGCIVDVKDGLVKRCTEEDCRRVLQNDNCQEHGEVDHDFDLRLKLVIDDGHEPTDVIVGKEMTEELTGISLEEAKEIARDKLDTSVVLDEMRKTLIGRYVSVEGEDRGRYIYASDSRIDVEVSQDEIKEIWNALEEIEVDI